MKRKYRWMVVVLLSAGLQVAACKETPDTATEEDEAGPAKIEHFENGDPARVTLTEEAAGRLDIQTATVGDVESKGARLKVIPYAAVLYDINGDTWTYISPEPLVFVRHRITVDHIEADRAILSDGPPSGTAVVTVGAAELYGSEIEFEEE